MWWIGGGGQGGVGAWGGEDARLGGLRLLRRRRCGIVCMLVGGPGSVRGILWVIAAG